MRAPTLLLTLTLLWSAPGFGAGRSWLDADGRPLPFDSVAEVTDFLATAQVVGTKSLSTGITEPTKIYLERDGLRVDAVFHHVDRRERQTRRLPGGQVVAHLLDSYKSQVAAFEVSRLLGLDSVPPTVVRTIDGRTGSLQLWVQNAVTEQMRRERQRW